MNIQNKTQKIRKIMQITVFLMMFLIPVLNLLEIYFIKGTFISMDIGSLGIADPVMIFQAMLAGRTAPAVLLASIVIPLLIMLFLGRVWCSWACPYTLMMETVEKIPLLGKKMAIRRQGLLTSGTKNRTTLIRYIIFIGFFILVGISGVPLLHLFSPPSVMSTQALLLVKPGIITVEILLIMVLLIIEIFFSYRFACRYICPTGTCLSLFTNPAALHVTYRGDCVQCGKCARECPMGLDPRYQSRDRLCYNCGLCLKVCPDESYPLKWQTGK